ALAQTKALLHGGVQSSMREALAAEAQTQTVNFATDAPEGFRAFVEKDDPDYTGAWRVRPAVR
ncbi:MAG: enoyl-CoA hydratase, partial [Actinomycetota bacterium]|nr:enoyl-CoA hydratase [Actinomycetota bacterium]